MDAYNITETIGVFILEKFSPEVLVSIDEDRVFKVSDEKVGDELIDAILPELKKLAEKVAANFNEEQIKQLWQVRFEEHVSECQLIDRETYEAI